MSGERQSNDPWRYRCPEGHASLRRNKGPVARKRTTYQYEKIETRSGHDYQGQFYCRSCDEFYNEIIDKKTGSTISGRTPA